MTRPPALITTEEADRGLDRLRADRDLISERLVALDDHPGQRFLDGAALTGDSRRRWAETKSAIGTLWARFGLYRGVLDRAEQTRNRRGRPGEEELAELTELLRGQPVELPVVAAPTAPASLTASGTERVSVAELVDRMNADYATVSAVLDSADRTWSLLASRLDPLTAALGAANSLAGVLGVAGAPGSTAAAELAEVDADLHRLRSDVLSDPLVAHDGLDRRLVEVQTVLDRVTGQLTALQRVRDDYPGLRAELAGRLDALAELARRWRQLAGEVRVKIAGQPLEVPDVVAGAGGADPVTGWLAELDQLHHQLAWTELAGRITEVTVEIGAAGTELTTAVGNLTGLLDRRTELRGRLGAYRAKAGALGHGEDPELAELHHRADDLLRTAPCDLRAATVAVTGYQRAVLAITEPAERGEPRR